MADKNNEHVEETPAEPEAVTPEEPEAAEAVEPVAESELVDEPVVEAEPASEEPSSEEPVAEAEPAEAAPDEEHADEDEVEAPAAPTRKTKKRLPRSARQQRTKPKREKPAERKTIVRLPKPEHVRGRRQERQGLVVSAATDKTIVVRVDTVKIHRRYKKVIRRSTKLHAHDETNQAKVGDLVRIVETRPVSKHKRWRLQEVVEAAK
jgi:small subunit ribosomal protein S17